MIRLLIILLVAGLIATGVAVLVDTPGAFDLVVGSYAVHTTVAMAAALILLAVAAVFVLVWLIAGLIGAPGRFWAWARKRRSRNGLIALSRGLVAAAAGDPAETRRFARRGEKLLGAAPLGLLLAAEAAELDEDETKQRDVYGAMLRDPHMEMLGLRGLYRMAMRHGDETEALKQARRAHDLKPKAGWAAQALFDLYVSRHDWDGAQGVLKQQLRAHLVSSDSARRRRAVLLAGAARDFDKAGQDEAATRAALEAATLAPSLSAAASLAARKLAISGRTWKAQDLIEAAWTQAPHPDLASAYGAISPTDDADARARRMQTLVGLNPDHPESRLLAAEQAIAQERWYDAKAALEPLTQGFPTARACTLMAEIAQAERGDLTAAQGWLARAARAPRDGQWRCAHCGFVAQDWSPLCHNCGAFDTLAWVGPRAEVEIIGPPPAAMPPPPTPIDVRPTALEAADDRPVLPGPPDDPGTTADHEPEDEDAGDPYEAEPAADGPEGPVRRREP